MNVWSPPRSESAKTSSQQALLDSAVRRHWIIWAGLAPGYVGMGFGLSSLLGDAARAPALAFVAAAQAVCGLVIWSIRCRPDLWVRGLERDHTAGPRVVMRAQQSRIVAWAFNGAGMLTALAAYMGHSSALSAGALGATAIFHVIMAPRRARLAEAIGRLPAAPAPAE